METSKELVSKTGKVSADHPKFRKSMVDVEALIMNAKLSVQRE